MFFLAKSTVPIRPVLANVTKGYAAGMNNGFVMNSLQRMICARREVAVGKQQALAVAFA
ncbi:hypothetical protein [Hymenobacter sp. GOD-10R]|uniref:hypothetical protein n=1 Tax=Hymenobacter sp. GOD-10R TaxID=3093922 RepID=UPI002D78C1B3|nr:hypothetical protein [Hymenobacter sp. GOD-10R]WRQ31682.1 hypothetical protein SD425_28640 [Hymenobacter sp. GOD-10R]